MRELLNTSDDWDLQNAENTYINTTITSLSRKTWVDTAYQFSLALQPKLNQTPNLDLLGAFVKVNTTYFHLKFKKLIYLLFQQTRDVNFNVGTKQKLLTRSLNQFTTCIVFVNMPRGNGTIIYELDTRKIVHSRRAFREIENINSPREGWREARRNGNQLIHITADDLFKNIAETTLFFWMPSANFI